MGEFLRKTHVLRRGRRIRIGNDRAGVIAFMLFEREVRGEEEEGGVGEVGKGAKVVDGAETKLSATKFVDRFRLRGTEVGVTLQGFDGSVVDGDACDSGGVDDEVVSECVEMKFR